MSYLIGFRQKEGATHTTRRFLRQLEWDRKVNSLLVGGDLT
jgi:hypothetical protein